MKIKRMLLFAALLCCTSAFADEGMWMVNAISEALVRKMQAQGLQISDKEIYSEDALSIKDAIVSLDFGCTGSMISENGLLITNHHCAYSDIHAISTPEKNYLEAGFYADIRQNEIPIKGKKAYFLHKILDVTDEVHQLEADEKAAGRGAGFRRISYLIEKKYHNQTGYEASASSMWSGSKYYLALYEVYTDLRLVAAPPVSISSFGGDIDNWEWPQQKCDFAMYRIYTSPDGKPADYDEANIPLRPAKYLQISTEGVKPGDFTMILGYPGSTNRYSSFSKNEFNQNLSLPISNEIRREQMRITKEWMDKDPNIRLKYSNRFFSLSNVQENKESLEHCVDRFKVLKHKKRIDRELQAANKELLDSLQTKYNEVRESERNLIYYRENIARGSQLAIIASRLKNTRNNIDMDKEYAGIDLRLEKDLLRYNMASYFDHIDTSLLGPYQKELKARFGSDYDAMLEEIWTEERLTRDSKLFRFFTDVTTNNFRKANSLDAADESITNLNRRYTRALYQHRNKRGKLQYPDANSTMRISYGTVRSFRRDGKMLPWQTNTKEILAKEDNSYEFTLLPDWRTLLTESESVPANFISNNDITGGNSGSPVLNACGEIVGLAFDGNKESLASDIYWIDDYNRCVNVDIRFVIFNLRNYGKCENILKEIKQ